MSNVNNEDLNMFYNGMDHDFATQECCFINNTNFIVQQTNDGTSKYFIGPGADILLAGNISYQSFNDAFDHEQSLSIGEAGFNGTDSESNIKSHFYYTIFNDQKNIDSIKNKVNDICPDYNNLIFSHDNFVDVFPKTNPFTEYPWPSVDGIIDSDIEDDDIVIQPNQTPYPTPIPEKSAFSSIFPTRSDFRLVITDISFEGRSIHPTPCPTNQLSNTYPFTTSNSLIQSLDFSQSSPFLSTNDFTISRSFSNSKFFPSSEGFSESISFTQSEDFSESISFTQSEDFSESRVFSESCILSDSSPFSKSSLLSESISFTQSELFSESLSFTPSPVFSVSISFSQSTLFSVSIIFSHSSLSKGMIFTESKSIFFSESALFSQSNGMITRTIDFILSKDWDNDLISATENIPENNGTFILINNNRSENSKRHIIIIVFFSVAGIVLIVSLILTILYISRRKMHLDSTNHPNIMKQHGNEQYITNILYLMDKSDPFREDFEEVSFSRKHSYETDYL